MLTQKEAEHLLNLHKKKASKDTYNFPLNSELVSIPLVSLDERENFLLDINRGSICLKCTFQKRYNKTIVLIRLDLNGPPHTNPEVRTVPLDILWPYNGETLGGCHMHLYIEGFFDKWAIPLPTICFRNPSDIFLSLDDFVRYCNIIDPPTIQRGLF